MTLVCSGDFQLCLLRRYPPGMSFDPADRRPAYEQIAQDLRTFIASDAVAVGDKLPSLSELIEKYGRSLNTVRAGLNALQDEGLVMTRQGEGAFVLKKPVGDAGSVVTPREMLDSFRRINDSLDELRDRLTAVEARVFG